eukprot:scaffold2109_cov123-Isochrysis_galbana.AAC.2
MEALWPCETRSSSASRPSFSIERDCRWSLNAGKIVERAGAGFFEPPPTLCGLPPCGLSDGCCEADLEQIISPQRDPAPPMRPCPAPPPIGPPPTAPPIAGSMPPSSDASPTSAPA